MNEIYTDEIHTDKMSITKTLSGNIRVDLKMPTGVKHNASVKRDFIPNG